MSFEVVVSGNKTAKLWQTHLAPLGLALALMGCAPQPLAEVPASSSPPKPSPDRAPTEVISARDDKSGNASSQTKVETPQAEPAVAPLTPEPPVPTDEPDALISDPNWDYSRCALKTRGASLRDSAAIEQLLLAHDKRPEYGWKLIGSQAWNIGERHLRLYSIGHGYDGGAWIVVDESENHVSLGSVCWNFGGDGAGPPELQLAQHAPVVLSRWRANFHGQTCHETRPCCLKSGAVAWAAVEVKTEGLTLLWQGESDSDGIISGEEDDCEGAFPDITEDPDQVQLMEKRAVLHLLRCEPGKSAAEAWVYRDGRFHPQAKVPGACPLSENSSR